MAGLAIVAATVVACGTDDGDDPVASDPTTSSSSPASPSVSDSPSTSESPSASETISDDPVPSPIINKAVRAAIADGFPALIPAGVPAGWTVLRAAYGAKGGGGWTIALTDPNGAPVTLVQSTADVDAMVAQLVAGAQETGKVNLSGTGKWVTYAGAGGAALAKALSGTAVVITGPDQDTLVTLAEQLLTAEDAGNGDGG
jgi:cytoskeletal protein RodZ